MRAMVLREPGVTGHPPLREEELPAPVPGPGELAIAVEACAVCRTDLQLVQGDLTARRLPIVPGHQIVGRVSAVGAGAYWLAGACGRCRHCRAGRENLCEQAEFTGWDRDGGFATDTVVRAAFAVPLPHDRPAAALAPLLCGGVIGHRALRVSGAGPGDTLGLFGFGASARSTLQVARHLGCRVMVCTRGDVDRARARALGAEWAGDFDELPPVPLDAAITFAPVGEVVVNALRALDRGGTVAINAIHLDRVPEFPYSLLWWERSVRSVANVTRADAEEFLALAAAIPVVTDHTDYPLTDANRALADLADGTLSGSAVLVV